MIGKLSRPPGNFPHHPESFQTILELSRPSGDFMGHLKPSRPLGHIPDHSETFQTIPELPSPSGNFPDHSTELQIQPNQSNMRAKWWPMYQFSSFPDHLDTFQILRQLCRPSRNFPDHLNIFQTTQKLSGPSRHFPDPPEAFQTVWKFAVQFQGYAQKLSGRQCHPATQVFGLCDFPCSAQKHHSNTDVTFYLPANLAPADVRQCSEVGILIFYQVNCCPYSTLLLLQGKLISLKMLISSDLPWHYLTW